MHTLLIVAAACSALFTVLTVLGLIDPRLGLSRTRERALVRNGALALVFYLLMAATLSAGDPRQRIMLGAPAPAASTGARPAR
ncbi:hypothetical protein BMS3Bbin12_01608 [bacterium BMS3Bbin12]|nr:hypothetical protein BMS3Abin12_01830 [bacterium BMS3Abin12]GBE48430.1 hypothetical protein BMS3Bbin12_01608 [bacterium BMS3Bbin12]GBE50575.1 hypothetical protein BMS3Bbin13_01515 [bacterium BMS3Bbin13]HDK03115.1 hypothetical protein [Gammaproteobacteria bacterium]